MKTVLPLRRSQILAARDEKRERNETSDFDISEDKKVLEMRGRRRRRGRQRRRGLLKTATKLRVIYNCGTAKIAFPHNGPQIIKYQEHPPNSRFCITTLSYISSARGE
jgi:hypothetical protein